MKASNSKKAKIIISLQQKIILVISSVFLSFFLLEISLRVGGFILLSLQEYRNKISLKSKDSYRIICFGESTTQGQYPHFLEEILNQRKIETRFSVIDKGLGGGLIQRLY
jgi:hypothetical protein